MVDRLRAKEFPVRRRQWQVRVLDDRDIMVRHLPAMIAAVEAHLWHRTRTHIGARVQLANLLEADDLGPEPMGLLDVADV